MKWILLDLAIALAALAVLAFLVLGLWRRVKALSRTVNEAGEAVAKASDSLAAAQAESPPGSATQTAGGLPVARHAAPGRTLSASSPRRGARP